MPPKTASNSLKECLLDSSLKIEEFPKNFKYPEIHLFLSEIKLVFGIKDLEKYKVVQICRNPYTRFASLYYHNIRLLPKNHPLLELNIEEYADKALKSIVSENYLDEFYGEDKFYYKSIKNKKSWGGTRTILEQTQWCDAPANIKYFKIEDLQDSMDSVSEFIGTYLPELNVVNKNKTDVNYDSVMTDKFKSLVQKLHYGDFKKLEYPTD
jgi:hypothetical protein